MEKFNSKTPDAKNYMLRKLTEILKHLERENKNEHIETLQSVAQTDIDINEYLIILENDGFVKYVDEEKKMVKLTTDGKQFLSNFREYKYRY